MANQFMEVITSDFIELENDTLEFRPTKLILLPKGAVGDKPSFAILGTIPFNDDVIGQLSLETLQDCLNDLGYELKKKE